MPSPGWVVVTCRSEIEFTRTLLLQVFSACLNALTSAFLNKPCSQGPRFLKITDHSSSYSARFTSTPILTPTAPPPLNRQAGEADSGIFDKIGELHAKQAIGKHRSSNWISRIGMMATSVALTPSAADTDCHGTATRDVTTGLLMADPSPCPAGGPRGGPTCTGSLSLNSVKFSDS